MTSFQKTHSLEARIVERERIAVSYPGQIPMVVTAKKLKGEQLLALPATYTVAQLEVAVRNAFDENGRVVLTVNGCSPAANTLLSDLYEACKQQEDGFLYVSCNTEKALGFMCFGSGTSNSNDSMIVIPGV